MRLNALKPALMVRLAAHAAVFAWVDTDACVRSETALPLLTRPQPGVAAAGLLLWRNSSLAYRRLQEWARAASRPAAPQWRLAAGRWTPAGGRVAWEQRELQLLTGTNASGAWHRCLPAAAAPLRRCDLQWLGAARQSGAHRAPHAAALWRRWCPPRKTRRSGRRLSTKCAVPLASDGQRLLPPPPEWDAAEGGGALPSGAAFAHATCLPNPADKVRYAGGRADGIARGRPLCLS
eukprot:gene3222-13380_t